MPTRGAADDREHRLHIALPGGRIVIKGGSAGGFTVLNALVHHPGVFRAGLCLYGVTNLFSLATDTH